MTDPMDPALGDTPPAPNSEPAAPPEDAPTDEQPTPPPVEPAPAAPDVPEGPSRLRISLRALILIAAVVGVIVHQAQMWEWFIEDAAISFAYAKHWATGEGLVAFAGGERTEGYSNPTWVALIAFFSLFGADEFETARWAQLVLGAATVPFVWLIAREAVPERARNEAPLVAVIALAANPQFALWGACGLENGLFNFLMSVALWLMLVEARRPGWPWSALVWFLLAITRPEAIMYAAAAGFWSMVFAFTDKRGVASTAKWLLTFWLPFGAYHALRFNYFAYEFPQTYYAKLGERNPRVLNWGGLGWNYVRKWAAEVWQGWFAPIYMVALVGLRRWRGAIALAAVLLVCGGLVLPVNDSLRGMPWWPWRLSAAPPELVANRSTIIALAIAILPVFGVGGPGWKARVTTWTMAAISLFFAVYAMGDWMKGYRWLSLLAVPTAVLYGVGVGELAEWFGRLERRARADQGLHLGDEPPRPAPRRLGRARQRRGPRAVHPAHPAWRAAHPAHQLPRRHLALRCPPPRQLRQARH